MGSLKSYCLAALAIVALNACVKQPKEKHRFIKKVSLSMEPTDTVAKGNRTKGDAASGSYYCHMDKNAGFGVGCFFHLPDSLINKHIRVIIKCKARKKRSGSGQAIVVALQPDNSTVYQWTSLDMDVLLDENETWQTVCDSTQIPAWINNKKGNEVRVFGFYSNQKSYLDYDDLEITYKQVEYLSEEQKQ